MEFGERGLITRVAGSIVQIGEGRESRMGETLTCGEMVPRL